LPFTQPVVELEPGLVQLLKAVEDPLRHWSRFAAGFTVAANAVDVKVATNAQTAATATDAATVLRRVPERRRRRRGAKTLSAIPAPLFVAQVRPASPRAGSE
jgi:hypothetical protein